MNINVLIFLCIVLIILIFVLRNFRYLCQFIKGIINEIRDIAKPANMGGYLKLIQIIFILTLLGLFVLSFIYFLWNDNPVSPVEVVFTVIVGWLGFILARFFGERAMELTSEQYSNIKKIQDRTQHMMNRIDESEQREEDYQDLTTKYEEKINHFIKYIEQLENKIKRLTRK
jgi:phosphoglycerol transferase MdoB-like AlkP superfamily enzyme